MAESILLQVAGNLLDKLAPFVVEEVSLAWGLKEELRKLQRDLDAIVAVIADAEQRQSQDCTLRLWLDNLTDVLYDSENVLDELECDALRKKVTEAGKLLGKVRYFFSSSNPIAFRFKMGQRLREIRKTLDEINTRKDAFNLNQQPGSGSGGASQTISRETHSHVHLREIIGRENDRDAIVERLKCRDTVKNPFIVSIVGIGGLGKTTLAKMVYNDSKVEFEERIWVCVSEDFNLKKILRKIVKRLDPTAAPSSHNMDLEDLQSNLRKLLKGKKFLLVLDDVWNEDGEKWNTLSDLLTGGNRGSSIIVTTRSLKVASMAGTSYEHKLGALPHDSCMAILNKPYADGLARSIDPEIFEIVQEIIKKCGGVPLAVKALGGLLNSNADVRYWRSIKDKDTFTALQDKGNDVEKIISDFKLSYDVLPPHLKRCFRFCSLFPKDFQFSSRDIAVYWKSLGFIDLRNNKNQNPEVIVDQYIKQMLTRSFFQDFKDKGIALSFKIHDLMHNLALYVASPECSTEKFEDPRVQHVSVSANTFNGNEASPPKLSFLNKANSYRTLMLKDDSTGSSISKELLEACISSSKYLRVLDLQGSNFEVMPSSIGRLKHLRFLNISFNGSIRRLPDSICNLQSLEALSLLECTSLEELPRYMWKLISLECLYLTTKQKTLMSSGIRFLKSLKDLVIIKCNNLGSLFERMDAKDLPALQRLSIGRCGSLTCIPVNKLKFLTSLETLEIEDCPKLDMSMDEETFPSTLRTIWIKGLPRTLTLPKWLLESANTLESLSIKRCEQLKELPEWLKNFRNLKRFEIKKCDKVDSLPDGMQSLTALRQLIIDSCRELTDRCQLNGPDWSKIAHIPQIEIDGERINH